jgi:hypothetical protein
MGGIYLLRAAIASALALLVTGCAAVAPLTSMVTSSGLISSDQVHSETSIRLEQANFVTVRTNVIGTSKGFKLLGFITLRPATLHTAMSRMYASAEAQPGRPQVFANLIVEHSGVYVILFSIPEVTTRADLIEYIDVSQPDEEELPPQTDRMQRVSYPSVPARRVRR